MPNKTIKLKNNSKTIAQILYLEGFGSYLIYENKLDNNKSFSCNHSATDKTQSPSQPCLNPTILSIESKT
jgi:hypothetical protein